MELEQYVNRADWPPSLPLPVPLWVRHQSALVDAPKRPIATRATYDVVASFDGKPLNAVDWRVAGGGYLVFGV